ncbi:hypothetical protein FXO37_11411 [Capsicum annuum]|nr:hypothetical protein FXO37_11411 [Capsicum annuum]
MRRKGKLKKLQSQAILMTMLKSFLVMIGRRREGIGAALQENFQGALLMCYYNDNDIEESLQAILTKEQYKHFFDNNILGYFMKKKQCVVQAQSCRCVTSLETKESSTIAIVISANGTSLHFTPREFAIIIELNYVDEEAVISKKVFEAFRDEQQPEKKEPDHPHMDDAVVQTLPTRFNSDVVTSSDKKFDGTMSFDGDVDGKSHAYKLLLSLQVLDECRSALRNFFERYIFIYDSYESSDHYVVLLAEIEKLAEIIPLCLKACNFHKNNAIDLDNHPRYKDKDMLNLFDMLFIEDFPQQPSESLSFRRSFVFRRQYYFTKYDF